MHYILYVSQAHRQMSNDQLNSLLTVSRANNKRDKITGLLIYKRWKHDERANFLQLLEGPTDAVKQAYEKIKKDTRHHTIVALEQGDISERNFSEWSMGFKNLDIDELSKFSGFRNVDEGSFDPDDFSAKIQPALETMKLFYQND